MRVRTVLAPACLSLLSCAAHSVGGGVPSGGGGGNDGTGGAANGGAGQGGVGGGDADHDARGRAGFAGSGCYHGTLAVETEVQASGFDYPDGTVVRATDSIEDGAFSFAFNQPSEACNLQGTIEEAAAFYIDANGDGACSLAEDYVFVWLAYSGVGYPSPASSSGPRFSISPSSPRCPMYTGDADRAVDVVRRLCREIGSCVPFCSASVPGQAYPGHVLECTDAGVDAGPTDASLLDAGP